MSNEKCFCHFNGYAVKDATARKLIEQNAANIVKAMQEAQNVKVYADNIKGEIELGGFIASLKEVNHGRKLMFWVGTQEEYDLLTELREDCFYIVTDDKTLEKITAAVEEMKNGLSELTEAVEENKTLISALTEAVEENKTLISELAAAGEESAQILAQRLENAEQRISETVIPFDYVVSRGEIVLSSGVWKYEKWNSGIIKVYIKEVRENLSFIQEGPIYRSVDKSFVFPRDLEIKDVHSVICQANGRYYAAWGGQGYASDDNSYIAVDVYTPFIEGITDFTTNIHIEVIGTWK